MTSFLITAKRTNRFSSLEKILVHTVHEGEFSGIPATGKELEWTAIEIFQVSEGKVKARWEMADHP